MPQSFIQCPYCNAANPLATVRRVTKDKVSIKLIELEESSSSEVLSYELQCSLCQRDYKFIELDDFSWIENRLEPSDTMLETFKTKFPNVDFDSIYDNIVGITRPKRLLRRNHVHVCFEIEGVRAYIDCHQKKDRLRGLDIYEV